MAHHALHICLSIFLLYFQCITQISQYEGSDDEEEGGEGSLVAADTPSLAATAGRSGPGEARATLGDAGATLSDEPGMDVAA